MNETEQTDSLVNLKDVIKSLDQIKDTMVETRRSDRTLEYIARWNSPDFDSFKEIAVEMRKIINNYPDETKHPEIVLKALHQSQDLELKVSNILNFFEELALVVKKDLVDKDMIQDFFEYIFARYAALFKNYIEEDRKKRKYNELYINFTELNQQWQQTIN